MLEVQGRQLLRIVVLQLEERLGREDGLQLAPPLLEVDPRGALQAPLLQPVELGGSLLLARAAIFSA